MPFFQEDCCQDLGIAGENMDLIGLLEVCETEFSQQEGASPSSVNAGASKEIVALPEVCETDFSETVRSSVSTKALMASLRYSSLRLLRRLGLLLL